MDVADKMMTTHVPWKIVTGSKGQKHDGFEVDIKSLFIHLVGSFGLEEQAKGGKLEMVITIYGTKLDVKINHVTWGFNLTDINSRCPIRGKLICSDFKTMTRDRAKKEPGVVKKIADLTIFNQSKGKSGSYAHAACVGMQNHSKSKYLLHLTSLK
jgi:hypothetical protein